MSDPVETITLGGGCFWCTEAVYERVKGVTAVESGYSNGTTVRPSYEQVCTGTTGHNEVVKLVYDPAQISLRAILEIFFVIHDPTTLNRQGNDTGTQYRSAIFYHTPAQKTQAENIVRELTADKAFSGSIVTEIVPAVRFYVAERYHQEYFENNPNQPYCQFIVAPKVAKFRQKFAQKLKKSTA
ncbi:MAG: peptide-methionine (S)-S-oxide reductase MsrA [Variovorax sp.]